MDIIADHMGLSLTAFVSNTWNVLFAERKQHQKIS